MSTVRKMIDWTNLESYQGNKFRSFEELCYQIAKKLYGHMGRFTSIDDSGGGDGVEFYMTLPNGNQWGWQAKFYRPEPRISVRSRKKSIKNSLEVACKEHQFLKKWFLCTPTNFTTQEQSWFDNALPKSIPDYMKVELQHWGDSDFNDWLSEIRFVGKKLYFFGELELTFDWFRTQVSKQVAGIKDKFNPLLHTETNVDENIHALLGDVSFTQFVAEKIENLEIEFEEYKKTSADLKNTRPFQVNWGDSKADLLTAIDPLQNAIADAIEQIREVLALLREQKLGELQFIDLEGQYSETKQAFDRYREAELAFDISGVEYNGNESDKEIMLREANRIVILPKMVAANLLDSIRALVNRINCVKQPDLHIFGDAGVGKTHVAANICNDRIENELPALFVLGRHFTSDQPLHEQLLRIFDIPATYSWNDFLQALESAALAYRTRIPLVIDGLNEAMQNGRFSDVWKLGLPGLIQEIGQNKNLVLFTTCRSTYREDIWTNGDPENVCYTYGFEEYDVEAAVEKYFSWYRIKADLTATPLSQFHHPIYLKIFCESINAKRQEEKYIFVGEFTLFEVFDKYLKQCNRAICERLGIYRNTPILTHTLNAIAQYLWEQHSRHISLAELVRIVDGQILYNLNWENSKTKAILDEGLLVFRDWYANEEVVYFTYDLLGGYLVARYLIQKEVDNIKKFVQSEKTLASLFNKDYNEMHPLHDDISRCLAAMLPVKTGLYLHDLTNNERAFSISIRSLFEIPPEALSEACIKLVAKLFTYPLNRKSLLKLAIFTVGNVSHPLNALFWSEQIQALSMPERDISWSEYIRENIEHFDKTIVRLEELCRSDENLSNLELERINLLVEHIKWVLTTTSRPLRDKATRALYWYGRKMPEKFFNMVLRSLEINDIYVPERMLAASYGITMALHNHLNRVEFKEKILPRFAKDLYNLMFKKGASYSTTHILMRDYAMHTIELALLYNPELLNKSQKKRISPPFKEGGIRDWKEDPCAKKKLTGDGMATFGYGPVHMDFAKDVIGSISRRGNYSRKNFPTLKESISMVIWRIKKLGYTEERFEEIDKRIIRTSPHFNPWFKENAKPETYSEKYSWVAFFELSGFYADKYETGEDWEDLRIRTTHVNIDPSFPELPWNIKIIEKDYLKKGPKDLAKWILEGPRPDITHYLILDSIGDFNGPWVLLNGSIVQENYKIKRHISILPRGLLIKKKDINEFLEYKDRITVAAGNLPQIEEDYYVFAGEIPWCKTYPYREYQAEIMVPTGKKIHKRIPIDKKFKPTYIQVMDETIRVGGYSDEELRRGYSEVTEEEKVIFEVEVPVRLFCWESYHSNVNPGQSAYVLSKEIANELSLNIEPQSFDMLDCEGKKASITIEWGKPWHTNHGLIYLKKDLLEKYLEKRNEELVWIVWGHREYRSKDNEGLDEFVKRHKHKRYQPYEYIYFYSQIK